MLFPSTTRAPLFTNTNERGRPVITSGTVRTDTGQIIRAGESFQVGTGTGTQAFQSSEWAANRALGLNTMRVAVNSNGATLPLATLLSNLDIVVECARINRMYCMLGYFAATPGSWDDDIPGNTTKWITFWSAAAARYSALPWVFYEMVNEPTAWGQVSTFTTAARSGLRQVYDAMRAAAPDTIIAWPSSANLSPSASQYATLISGLDALGNGQPIDWTKCALAYHYYNQTQQLAVSGSSNNATDQGEAGLRALAATYPLLMTETNWWIEEARIGLVDALDLHESIGIGWGLLRRAGQTTPTRPDWPLNAGGLFLENKLAQLRDRGFNIPVE